MIALARLKRNEDSIAFANDVLSRAYESSETPRIYFWRATAYKRLGFKEDAIHDFDRAMAMDDRVAWSVHTQITQSGYLFGPQQKRRFNDDGPPLDVRAKEFTHALEACMIDPECMK